jgi:hypothetical protein
VPCRSQWPRGLRHEMSSPARTLGTWVRNPLETWTFVCVYSVFMLSCVGSGLATGWSLVQGVLPTVYKCMITEPHKEEAKAWYGLQRHIRRRRRRRRTNVPEGGEDKWEEERVGKGENEEDKQKENNVKNKDQTNKMKEKLMRRKIITKHIEVSEKQKYGHGSRLGP